MVEYNLPYSDEILQNIKSYLEAGIETEIKADNEWVSVYEYAIKSRIMSWEIHDIMELIENFPIRQIFF